MMAEPAHPPEIPYPFAPGRDIPRRTEPVMVPMVDLPSGEPAERLFERRTILLTGALEAAAVTRLCAQLMALDGRSAIPYLLVFQTHAAQRAILRPPIQSRSARRWRPSSMSRWGGACSSGAGTRL